MLKRARFATRVLLLPVCAGVALGLVLILAILLGRRNERLVYEVEQGYFPSFELSQSIEHALEKIRQGLRDAVAAGEVSGLAATDQLSNDALRQIEQAEDVLVALGFRQFRVHHHGEIARLELPVEEFPLALEQHAAIVAGVTAAGYRFVTLDLVGFRSGSLNGANVAGATVAVIPLADITVA